MTAADPPRHVLVTGAAGMLGTEVLKVLAAQGVPATALVLRHSDLADPGLAARVVAGDAADDALLSEALQGVDAVVHLAARTSPAAGTPMEVFNGNTRTTFAVLEAAGNAGVPRAVIASSYSILGMPFARRVLHPAYLPVDERTPLQIEDPYALSKHVDEATAQMMSRRYGTSIDALRLPFLGSGERLARRAGQARHTPRVVAPELWSYLDTRDAATAIWLALRATPHVGTRAFYLAAPTTLAPYPTEQLLAAFHPGVPLCQPLPDRTVPIDLTACRTLLGFQAEHVLDLPLCALPDELTS
jgi:nucleoside-diphosphate-sugar epimerase